DPGELGRDFVRDIEGLLHLRSVGLAQLALDLVQPVRARLHDPARESVAEEYVRPSGSEATARSPRRVQPLGEVGELRPQATQALEQRLLADGVGGAQP